MWRRACSRGLSGSICEVRRFSLPVEPTYPSRLPPHLSSFPCWTLQWSEDRKAYDNYKVQYRHHAFVVYMTYILTIQLKRRIDLKELSCVVLILVARIFCLWWWYVLVISSDAYFKYFFTTRAHNESVIIIIMHSTIEDYVIPMMWCMDAWLPSFTCLFGWSFSPLPAEPSGA